MGTLTKFPIHTVHELANQNRSGLCPMLVSEIRDTVGFNLITNGDFETRSDVAAWSLTSANVSVSASLSGDGINFTDYCANVAMGTHFNGTSDNIYGDGVQAICSIATPHLSLTDGSTAIFMGTEHFDGAYVVSGVGPTSFRFSSDYLGYETPLHTAVIRTKDWCGEFWKHTTTQTGIPMSLMTGRIYRFSG